MPWSYKIDREHRLVITTAWGNCSATEVLKHQSQLRRDAGFNCDFFQLLDFTRVTNVQMDITAVIEFADRGGFLAKSRRAFFVGSNPLAFGMSRMFIAFQKLNGEKQMKVFADRDEAWEWLFNDQ